MFKLSRKKAQNVGGGEQGGSNSKQKKSKDSKANSGLITFSSVSDSDIDIVAVHGLGGHYEDTWKHPDSEKLWLRDFLPSSLPRARIMSFGYDAATAFSKSVTNIEQVATSLLAALRAERMRTIGKDRPIIFICHSLGGIIVKKALIIAHERRSIYGSLLEDVRGMVFFSVPHRGCDMAAWATMAANICKIATFSTTTNVNFVKALQKRSKEFENITKQFTERSTGLYIRTFYETQRIRGLQIVDEDSVLLNIAEEVPVPILNTDHISICKFADSQSQSYKQVLLAIHELAAKATNENV